MPGGALSCGVKEDRMVFDPDAAGRPGSGIFGLPHSEAEAGIVLLPVPFDATVSYGTGTAGGPPAIYNASMQVDLYDRRYGRIYERGIHLRPESREIRELSRSARALAEPLIEAGGAEPHDREAVARVDAAGERVNAFTYEQTKRTLEAGKIPGLVGGDHSTPFGSIMACAERAAARGAGLGMLHIDAHMDFREAYEGFQWSHASIMHNVLMRIPQVSKIVQVGIRDFGEGEMDFGIEQGQRVTTFYDLDWAERMEAGELFADLAKEAVEHLPRDVYVSFDIDALEQPLCPNTGTPVPGGLTFNQAVILLDVVRRSGRTIVGFDLVEVAPGPDGDEWDANVGARMLYKLCGVSGPGR
jgi:agmatinase